MAYIACARCGFEIEVYPGGHRGDWVRWVAVCPNMAGYSGPIHGNFSCQNLQAAIDQAESQGDV